MKKINIPFILLILLLFSGCDYYEYNYRELQKNFNSLKKSAEGESQNSFKICKTVSEKEFNSKKQCHFKCDSGFAGVITIEKSNVCPIEFAESYKDSIEQLYEGYNSVK